LFNALFTLALTFLNRKCRNAIIILNASSISCLLISQNLIVTAFEALRKAQAIVPSNFEETNDALTDSILDGHAIAGDFHFFSHNVLFKSNIMCMSIYISSN
jgi:hypothetical protein